MTLTVNLAQINSAARGNSDLRETLTSLHLALQSVYAQTGSGPLKKVDSTANIKDAQDLQNRIASESGMLQSAMAKLNAMNVNLYANMLNQQNQATAATQKYFRRTQQ